MPEIFTAKDHHVTVASTSDPDKTSVKSGTPADVTKAKRKKHSMLSAFMVRPDGIRFETQEDKEDVLLLMRQHIITNLGWVTITILLVIAPVIILPLIIQTQVLPGILPLGYIVLLPILWYLGTAGFALTNFLQWYYNVYIVTNERIVDIDWYSLLFKQLSSAQLNKIQDVTYKQSGIWDSFFDFGNVFIQTAGSEENFEFEAVPHPERVVRQIDEIIEGKGEVGP